MLIAKFVIYTGIPVICFKTMAKPVTPPGAMAFGSRKKTKPIANKILLWLSYYIYNNFIPIPIHGHPPIQLHPLRTILET